jgi:putative FmdB family regulatory protein
MPLYEYRCRTCDDTFQLLRSVDAADTGVTCPGGHADTVRALSLVAPVRHSTAGAPAPVTGGGCCGGGGCCN